MTSAVRSSRPMVLAGGAVLLLAVGLLALMLVRPSSSAGPASPAAAPSDTSVDVGFARDMSIHHQQAVEMSFIVRDRTSDEAVRLPRTTSSTPRPISAA